MGARHPVPTWLLWAYGVAVALLAAILIGALVNLHHVGQQNHQALLALCALEDDLGHRIAAGQVALEQNGLTQADRSALEQAVANARMTVAAMRPHLQDCP